MYVTSHSPYKVSKLRRDALLVYAFMMVLCNERFTNKLTFVYSHCMADVEWSVACCPGEEQHSTTLNYDCLLIYSHFSIAVSYGCCGVPVT
jgi:hypothetical protein